MVPLHKVGETTIGGVIFSIYAGILATVEQMRTLTPEQVASTKLDRMSLGYLLQKAWYERDGGHEPDRVRKRREAHFASSQG